MRAFVRDTAIAAPLAGINIDTDQIIPARFMKRSRADGYGQYLFHDHRFEPDGSPRPDFVLNRPEFAGARILVAGRNFGCGSSRESAVYALVDYGINAVLAPSFGDIFHSNALKNGLIPAALSEEIVGELRNALNAGPERAVSVDLEAQTVTLPGGGSHRFPIDPFWRECILKGVDEIDLTRGHLEQIEAFERRYEQDRPWVVLP
ncbi:MAG TPA: 3-isopropylmalate dehydratase small subunit [Steroidobacteraceae bacterium]|nr:3-isopropylmalate dehydratase small subunit [Steroidobacteraceae bacterium]